MKYLKMDPRLGLIGDAFLVFLFNSAIAMLISLLLRDEYWPNFIISQVIGFTIAGILGLGALLVKDPGRLSTVKVMALVPVASLIGMTIAGWAVWDDPLFFFSSGATIFLSTLVAALLFGGVANHFFFSRYQALRSEKRLQQELLEGLRKEKLLAETHLKMLQAQIEPHFLFNTLSNVIGLIESEPLRAKELLEHMTRYLRATLHGTRKERLTVGDEVSLIGDYLQIQKLRMGARLSYSIDLEPTARDLPFPPFLIQPLVENALKHGLEGKISGGTVRVAARLLDGELRIEVRDDGPGLPSGSGVRPGVGLGNVNERFNALFGPGSSIRFVPNEPQGLCVQLVIPEPALRALRGSEEGTKR